MEVCHILKSSLLQKCSWKRLASMNDHHPKISFLQKKAKQNKKKTTTKQPKICQVDFLQVHHLYLARYIVNIGARSASLLPVSYVWSELSRHFWSDSLINSQDIKLTYVWHILITNWSYGIAMLMLNVPHSEQFSLLWLKYQKR